VAPSAWGALQLAAAEQQGPVAEVIDLFLSDDLIYN
jgi:hypothetical protein